MQGSSIHEVEILSSLMRKPESTLSALPYLRKAMFEDLFHARVWEACLNIISLGQTPDLARVCLEFPGEVARIAQITDSLGANLELHGAKLQEGYQRRSLRAAVYATGLDIERPDLTLEETLQRLEVSLTDITSSQASDEVASLSDAVHRLDVKVQYAIDSRGAPTGILTGIGAIDTAMDGFQKEDYIVLGARPSVGKTALALFMAYQQAKNGTPVAFFSLEMAATQLALRLVAMDSGLDSNRIRRGLLSTAEMDSYRRAKAEISTVPLTILDAPTCTMGEIRRYAHRVVRSEKAGILYVDYIGLIRPQGKRVSRYEHITEVSGELKSLARELKIPVVALSQIRREKEEDKRPALSDLRESGALEQDADAVLLLWGERKEGPGKQQRQLALAKHRNGPTAIAFLDFYPAIMRFEEEEQSGVVRNVELPSGPPPVVPSSAPVEREGELEIY